MIEAWLVIVNVSSFVTDVTRQQQSLREEAKVLKSTVHRLNQELSRYQTKFRKLDDKEVRCPLANSNCCTTVTSVY